MAVGKLKQPWRFVRNDSGRLAFARLWESWTDLATQPPLQTYTVLTTTPNSVTAALRDRMPVILEKVRSSRWLKPETTKDERLALCVSAPDTDLHRDPVITVVSNARNDGPECSEAEKLLT